MPPLAPRSAEKTAADWAAKSVAKTAASKVCYSGSQSDALSVEMWAAPTAPQMVVSMAACSAGEWAVQTDLCWVSQCFAKLVGNMVAYWAVPKEDR